MGRKRQEIHQPMKKQRERACGICRHALRAEIEAAGLGGTPQREIARRYGVSRGMVRRHLAAHVARGLGITPAGSGEDAHRLAEGLRWRERMADEIVVRTRERRPETAVRAIRAGTWCAQARARLLGAEQSADRSGAGKQEVNLVLECLREYPEARAKVAEVVGKLWEEGEKVA